MLTYFPARTLSGRHIVALSCVNRLTALLYALARSHAGRVAALNKDDMLALPALARRRSHASLAAALNKDDLFGLHAISSTPSEAQLRRRTISGHRRIACAHAEMLVEKMNLVTRNGAFSYCRAQKVSLVTSFYYTYS